MHSCMLWSYLQLSNEFVEVLIAILFIVGFVRSLVLANDDRGCAFICRLWFGSRALIGHWLDNHQAEMMEQ